MYPLGSGGAQCSIRRMIPPTTGPVSQDGPEDGNDLQAKSIAMAERLGDMPTISWVYMASGVLLSGVVAMLFANSGMAATVMATPLKWLIMLAPLGFVMGMSMGANRMQTFFKVVFPVLAPINIIVLVVTVIESLRAFDLVWIINKGRNGLELISTLVTANVVGEASRIGFGSALATIMLLISSVFIVIYLRIVMREDAR